MLKFVEVRDRRDITLTICRTPEEVEKGEREFLRKLTPAERILLTWQLSLEQWELKGANESNLTKHRRIARSFHSAPYTILFLSKAALLKNKRATGRPKDRYS